MHTVDIELAVTFVSADVLTDLNIPYITRSSRSRGQDAIGSLGGKQTFTADAKARG